MRDLDKQERLRELNKEMLKLSVAQRRQRWKHYLARIKSFSEESTLADRYRGFSTDALHEAETASLETRDEYLLVANAWQQLADAFEAVHAGDNDTLQRERPSRRARNSQRG